MWLPDEYHAVSCYNHLWSYVDKKGHRLKDHMDDRVGSGLELRNLQVMGDFLSVVRARFDYDPETGSFGNLLGSGELPDTRSSFTPAIILECCMVSTLEMLRLNT